MRSRDIQGIRFGRFIITAQYVKMAVACSKYEEDYSSILINFEDDFEIWMPLHWIRVDATSYNLQGVEWIFSYVRNESGP